ncbi:MAG: membrane protein insertase YidC [Hyphomicrobiales bacterium]
MTGDNKNLILAIVLSILVIGSYHFLYLAPQAAKQAEIQRQQAEQAEKAKQSQTQTQPGSSGQVPGTPQTPELARADAIAATKRVKIKTPDLEGSINLVGAALDDLQLAQYRETVNPASPAVVLLSPSGTPTGYFAEQGWTSDGTVKLPDPKTVWTAPEGAVLEADKPLTLTWDNGEGVVFKRTFSLSNHYLFTIKHEIENKTGNPISARPYARIQRQELPHVAGWWVFFEGMLGVFNQTLEEVHYKDLKDGQPQKFDSTGGWLGFTDKYWATAIIPNQGTAVASTFQHINQNGRDVFQTDYLARDPITAPAGGVATYEDKVFAGAKVVRTINDIQQAYNIDRFDLMIDWGWFYFLTKPMFWLLKHIQDIVGNFGIAILVVTLLVKAAVFPLANKSYASMSKMKKLQPEMAKIKERFPDDRMKQQQEIMALYKKEKVSPLAGCLPVVVQIPIFFALYKVILTSIDLRHAPFFGWIHDLSAPDPTTLFNLFGLIPWTPPHLLLVGVWPIVMGITMWLQMRLNPTPPDPIQASMFNYMPLIFTFMLASFPVGLVIYWAWSNTLSILQQSYIMRKNGVELDFLGNIRDSLPFLKKKPAS